VPLSEREQRVLDEIEKNLYREDPSFAREVKKGSPNFSEVRNAKLGVVLFIAGFISLFLFFLSQFIILGVVAFGAMVGGIVLIAGSARGVSAARRLNAPTAKERVAQAIANWEEKVKQRYKRD
jgi:hypothetical protein